MYTRTQSSKLLVMLVEAGNGLKPRAPRKVGTAPGRRREPVVQASGHTTKMEGRVEVVPLRRILTVLLCLGACLSLLSLPLSGSEASSTLGIANVLHVDQVANGYGSPVAGNNPLVPAKEAKERDKHPVNAGLLTMLFLAASFFGAGVEWTLTNAREQGALCFSLGVIGEVVASVCEDYSAFLGVFRL
jgi:hypothetical protein